MVVALARREAQVVAPPQECSFQGAAASRGRAAEGIHALRDPEPTLAQLARGTRSKGRPAAWLDPGGTGG
eukprot:5162638-Heterocapsa_arctica.AAC.1